MRCVSPYYLEDRHIFVDCGGCLACRIKRTSQWQMRMIHELKYHPERGGIFLTLTYNDDNLPMHGSLVKKDLQKFFKRLRKRLGDRKIRYYACGEYGEESSRPHYHAIIYNMTRADEELITNSWSFGYNYIGSVTLESCKYVAKYIQKTWSNVKDDEYNTTNREHPFQVCSQGLGKFYAMDNKEKILKNGCIINSYGDKLPVPRYYRKKLEADFSEQGKIAFYEFTDILIDRYLKNNPSTSYTKKKLHLLRATEAREFNVVIMKERQDANKQMFKNARAKIALKALQKKGTHKI